MDREPHWISLTRLGCPYEEEMDVNADPEAGDQVRMRHRPISFTGQVVHEWSPGSAPTDTALALARGDQK